jgi:hypothetical protein
MVSHKRSGIALRALVVLAGAFVEVNAVTEPADRAERAMVIDVFIMMGERM